MFFAPAKVEFIIKVRLQNGIVGRVKKIMDA